MKVFLDENGMRKAPVWLESFKRKIKWIEKDIAEEYNFDIMHAFNQGYVKALWDAAENKPDLDAAFEEFMDGFHQKGKDSEATLGGSDQATEGE